VGARNSEEYQNVGFSIGGFETSDFASVVLVGWIFGVGVCKKNSEFYTQRVM
jgi:hypothetical protein